ncbi:MAG: 6,7-dimethyl-8-ribityllumazine synthase [bacterium]
MAKEIRGSIKGEGLKIAVIVASFNSFITNGLRQGAENGLVENGVSDSDITVIRCPGSFEIPFITQRCISKGLFDAVITLGAVIQGETDHYSYVCDAVTQGITQISLKSPIPVIFGILTCQNVELAQARAGDNRKNKGYECALAALEMADLIRQIES